MSRRSLGALLLVLVAAAACGEPDPFPPEHWIPRLGAEDEGRREEAIEALGKLGRADPEKVGGVLVGLLERRGEMAILGVRVEPDLSGVSPAAQPRQVADLGLGVRRRLELAGATVTRIVVEPTFVDVYVVRPEAARDAESAHTLVQAEAARPGTVDLRVELPPPAPPTAERPVSPFLGEAAAYDAWLAAERERFAAQGASAYRPTVEGRRVLPRASGAESEGLVPVLEPGGHAHTFTEADLSFLPQDDQGVPALTVSAAAARAEEFRAFLRSHAGLRLWLVIDGRAAHATRIPVQAAPSIVFRMNAPTLAEGRTRAALVAALAGLGRYAVPVTVSLKPRAPVIAPDNPLARAIVAIGPGVEPLLDALAQRDPSWGPLVVSLKEAILKGRASQR